MRGDLFGGFTAAVVALPLALAFGVASGEHLAHALCSLRHACDTLAAEPGAGPLAGLYGAVITGFFAALLGGTPSQARPALRHVPQ